MMTIAGFAVPRLFHRADDRPAPRRSAPKATTLSLREETDLGECVATGVHAIFAPVRTYLCVTMAPKPQALAAQREADKKLAAGQFEVDELWSAAAVNARWGRRAALVDEAGEVVYRAVCGARGMTDAGAREVFFEFGALALEACPQALYLSDGATRVRVK